MTERERAEAEVAEKERALTDAFEAPGGSWYDVPPSMVREGFADVAESGVNALKDLLIGATIGADPSTRTEPVWDQPMDWQELGEVGSLAMAPLAVGGRALLKRITNPIRAFHGSPHVFEQPYRFDLDRMGTGEGVQAFGHGGYFAENPDVSNYYRYSRYKPHMMDDPYDPTEIAHEILYRHEGNRSKAITELEKKIEGKFAAVRLAESDPINTQRYIDARKAELVDDSMKANQQALDLLKNADRHTLGPGGLYEVDLHVQPESDLLDLDLRLSEQTPAARAKIQSILDEESNIWGRLGDEPHAYTDRHPSGGGISYGGGGTPNQSDMSGAGFEDWLGTAMTPPTPRRDIMSFEARLEEQAREAAKRLHRAGLSGSRYWDQGSREAAEGTRNYVIWDPEVIDVRKKLAALLAVGGGATAADAFDQTPVEFGGR